MVSNKAVALSTKLLRRYDPFESFMSYSMNTRCLHSPESRPFLRENDQAIENNTMRAFKTTGRRLNPHNTFVTPSLSQISSMYSK
ncbi:hypothetical protein TWF128_010310 [Orbilia oligospora]|nr:hypothetical protein TWF128_010310 [Orbilia oligospora]